MFSNGNQYFPQGLQYIPGAYGASPYGGSGFGQEFGSAGFGQQGPSGGSFAAFGSNQSPVGPQLITTLSQLANQVVAHGVAAQQVGALLGQLTQQIVAQASYGNAAFVPAGLQGTPFLGAQAFNQLQQQLAIQGRLGQLGNAFGGVAGNPAFAGQGYGGFAPQMQVPQNQPWAINRPAVLQ